MTGKNQWDDDDGEDSPSRRVEFRWGHCEGITAIGCVQDGDGDTEKLLTCGGDNELRIWKGFDDSDPVAHELSDVAYTLHYSKGQIYVGTEMNTVEALSLDGTNLGVKAKFTAPVHHLDVSNDGKWLVAGSGDMTMQLVNLEDSSVPPININNTHTAPVLSVALDPLKKFLASSGCDGNVCIWSLAEDGQLEHIAKKFERIFSPSNDITTSETLCRISWESNGKILAVPEEGHVALYTRESWTKLKVLKAQKSKANTSVTVFSPCGKFLAAGGTDGTLIVWNIMDSSVLVESAQFTDQITGIIFSNNASDIIAADKKGRVLLLKDFKLVTPSESVKVQPSSKKSDEIENDISSPNVDDGSSDGGNEFDDGLDNLFDDVDDNEISISKIKAETGFVDDEYVGVDKAKKVIIGGDLGKGKGSDDENDDAMSVSSVSSKPRVVHVPQRIVIPFTEPQKSFQSASSPVHLDHRFMIWNNTGIIRNYTIEDDEKDAIDIEFHDAAVHHAIHLRNQEDYVIATLTKEIAVFANEKQPDAGSKLFCYHFMSWDSKKEWSTELPLGEEVIGLAAGEGWFAASTDMNRIRLFTIGGAQKQIIEVGGQIITTSAHEDLLFVVFHNGIGLHGNQCIAHSIFRIKSSVKPFPLITSEPLPVSPKSQVAWVGFSDEGTPVCSDSEDILRILSGRYWTTFCTMKDHLVGASDHFWVVGVSELSQRIRAVKCKGMKYPPTLPRPVLMQLDAQIPLCEMGTEKSRLEDSVHRSMMLGALSKKMDKKNYEVDDYKIQAEKELKESLFNLFRLSCQADWDARGAEYVSMMPTAHSVQIAVKAASKLRKKGLMDRLAAIGRRKMDEEEMALEMALEGDDDDFETLKMGTVVYSHVKNRTLPTPTTADYSASQDLFADCTGTSRSSTANLSFSNSYSANRSITVPSVPQEENPFIKKNNEEIRKLLGCTSDSLNSKFRKEKPQEPTTENGEGRGLSNIDSWKRPTDKPTDIFTKTFARNSKGAKKGADKDKNTKEPNSAKQKKKQATLLDMQSKKSKDSNNSTSTSNPASPMVVDMLEVSNDSACIENYDNLVKNGPISRESESLLEDSTNIPQEDRPKKEPQKKGYLLWFEENQQLLEKEHPDASTPELTKIGMPLYKALSKEEKQKYLNPGEDKKRKRNLTEDEELTDGESGKKSKLSSKLAAYVRPDE